MKPAIHVTENDHETLRKLALAAVSVPDVAEDLLAELERATTVDDTAGSQYIGIGSTATFQTSGGDEKTVQIVLPAEADIASGKISILTPIAVALLGLSAGQEIDWKARDGRKITLSVKAVHSA